MKKYILASDFDGTLCQMGKVSDETVKAIEQFRSCGNFFGVVTGRDYVNGFEFFKEMNWFPFDFIIASNGAVACDKNGNFYFKKTVKKGGVAKELIEEILLLTSKECGISLDKSRYDFHPEYPLGARCGKMEYAAFSMLDTVGEFTSANAVCESIERAKEVTEKLNKKFGEYVNAMQNGLCIDISPVGVNKAWGIAHLAECLGIHKDEVWTAGDNFNDIPMIEAFHGCAMTGGVEELKKASEYVCNTVADVIEVIMSK